MSRETSSKSRSYLQTICRPIWLDTSGTSIASSLGWFSAAKGGGSVVRVHGGTSWEHKLGVHGGSMVGCRAELDTTALGLRKDPRSLVYSPSPSLGMRRGIWIWFFGLPNFSDLSQTSQLSAHWCPQPLLAWIIRRQQTTSSHVNPSNLQAP